jgi:hypothetical protein
VTQYQRFSPTTSKATYQLQATESFFPCSIPTERIMQFGQLQIGIRLLQSAPLGSTSGHHSSPFGAFAASTSKDADGSGSSMVAAAASSLVAGEGEDAPGSGTTIINSDCSINGTEHGELSLSVKMSFHYCSFRLSLSTLAAPAPYHLPTFFPVPLSQSRRCLRTSICR